MRAKDKKLTSVRLDPEMYEEFKHACIKDNLTFQELASRAMFLYLEDNRFRNTILEQRTTKLK